MISNDVLLVKIGLGRFGIPSTIIYQLLKRFVKPLNHPTFLLSATVGVLKAVSSGVEDVQRWRNGCHRRRAELSRLDRGARDGEAVGKYGEMLGIYSTKQCEYTLRVHWRVFGFASHKPIQHPPAPPVGELRRVVADAAPSVPVIFTLKWGTAFWTLGILRWFMCLYVILWYSMYVDM